MFGSRDEGLRLSHGWSQGLPRHDSVGATSTTDDREGVIAATYLPPSLSSTDIRAAASRFVGDIDQCRRHLPRSRLAGSDYTSGRAREKTWPSRLAESMSPGLTSYPGLLLMPRSKSSAQRARIFEQSPVTLDRPYPRVHTSQVCVEDRVGSLRSRTALAWMTSPGRRGQDTWTAY